MNYENMRKLFTNLEYIENFSSLRQKELYKGDAYCPQQVEKLENWIEQAKEEIFQLVQK